MNFACPSCSLAGQIDDAKLPEQGLYATCPKCKTRFLVRLEMPISPADVPDGTGNGNGQEGVVTVQDNPAPFAAPQSTKKAASPVQRDLPVAVKVIGCLFIAVAGFKIIGAGMGFLAFSSLAKMANGIPQMSSGSGAASNPFQYFGLWIGVQILIGVFVIVAAIQFLRLRAWARTTLEVVSWIGLAYSIGTSIMAIFSFSNLIGSAADAGFGNAPSALGSMAVTMTAVYMVLFSVPLIVIIWFLRGETIRDAVR